MKKNLRFFVLAIIVFGMTSAATTLFYNIYIIDEVILVPNQVKIDDKMGLNVDTDKLYFGKLIPGNTGQRDIFLNNTKEYSLQVSVLKEGETAEWISLSKNNFIVLPGARTNVTVYASPPKNPPPAKRAYEGHLKVVMKRVLFS